MPRAFAVLQHLVEHAGRLVTKEALLATVWRDAAVSDVALSTCIRDLRRALRDSPDAPRYIETVHRRGFRFVGPLAAPGATSDVPAGTAPAAAISARIEPASPPTLVGRDAELARLHELLRKALNRHRQLVFVTGESGIGKTALIDAYLARIGRPDFLHVGWGQCVEQYGAGETYLPLLEALASLGREPRGGEVVRVLKQRAPTWLVQQPALLGAVQRRAHGATRERMLRELVEAKDKDGQPFDGGHTYRMTVPPKAPVKQSSRMKPCARRGVRLAAHHPNFRGTPRNSRIHRTTSASF